MVGYTSYFQLIKNEMLKTTISNDLLIIQHASKVSAFILILKIFIKDCLKIVEKLRLQMMNGINSKIFSSKRGHIERKEIHPSQQFYLFNVSRQYILYSQ